MESVYCAVRTGSSSKVFFTLRLLQANKIVTNTSGKYLWVCWPQLKCLRCKGRCSAEWNTTLLLWRESSFIPISFINFHLGWNSKENKVRRSLVTGTETPADGVVMNCCPVLEQLSLVNSFRWKCLFKNLIAHAKSSHILQRTSQTVCHA